ncbi:hypothetical protein [uncultured Ruegeria sp.]|uniref:hypothetical protein n=1 Tax=uncultured Ruegeria sp. TaxID=259304 RepID=UPI00261BAA9F|nr:hypothetical protein [uncultured Ruegeria sp.]
MSVTQTVNTSVSNDRPANTEPLLGAARIALIATISVWMGAAISGNLIAAPAKFQAPSLTLPIALDVGRMQFLWIGVFEAFCALLIVVLLLSSRQKPSLPLIAALCVFGFQRLWLLPLLNTRTLSIIAGQPVEDSSLHLLYVAAEFLKIGFLFWAGIREMRGLFRKTKPTAVSVQT